MKKYLELYVYYKERILDGQLRHGDRLPSIREAAAIHGVSRTTVENAYFALQAEGFLLSSDRSGYYVSRKAGTKRAAPKPATAGRTKNWNSTSPIMTSSAPCAARRTSPASASST